MLKFFVEVAIVLLFVAAIILCIWDALPDLLKIVVIIVGMVEICKALLRR